MDVIGMDLFKYGFANEVNGFRTYSSIAVTTSVSNNRLSGWMTLPTNIFTNRGPSLLLRNLFESFGSTVQIFRDSTFSLISTKAISLRLLRRFMIEKKVKDEHPKSVNFFICFLHLSSIIISRTFHHLCFDTGGENVICDFCTTLETSILYFKP